MKRLFSTRKALATAVIGGLAVLGTGIGAYAYWTSNGSGTGLANVGTDSGVTITPHGTVNNLYPGSSATVGFTITNNSSSTPVKVGTVVLDTAGIVVDTTHATAGCLATDFTWTVPTLNAEIAASSAVTGTSTVQMADTALNQNACKGASLTVNLKVDNSAL
jgi:hypothetical protein